MKPHFRFFIATFLLVPVALLLSGCNKSGLETKKEGTRAIEKKQETDAKPPLIVVGAEPILNFKAYDGREVSLAAWKGKVIIVDFWATWCVPCVKAMPEIKSVYQKHHPNGMEIIGISLDEEEAPFKKFLKDENIEWPQFYDGKGEDNKYANEFSLPQIPTTWLIDRKGKIRFISPEGSLDKKIQMLMDEKP